MTSLHADEAFLAHYQFSHDPFAPRVPGFKFFPAQRKPVLGQLHHLARYSQLLLVVTGPEGSGKTLLRQALVASTNKQAVQSVVIAQGITGGEALLRQVAQGLSLATADTRSILNQVSQLALTGQEVYLLIDDADQLDDAALQVVLTLAAGDGEGRPHVFLFAEQALLERLEALASGEECYHAIELQPYTEEETRDYLAQRLEGAGQGIEVLSEEQVEEIHQRSGGWPGAINGEARELLIEQMLAQRSGARRGGFSFSLPKKHLLALAVVLVGVAAAWVMQGRDSQPASEPELSATLPLQPSAAPADGKAPEPQAASGAPAIEFAGSSQPLPLPLVGQPQAVIRQPLAEAAGEELDNFEPPAAPDPSTVTVPPAPIAAAPAPAPAPAAPKPATQQQLKQTETKQAEPAVAAKPAPAPSPATAKPATPSPAGGNWYAQQPASRYALQVVGSRSEANIQAMVREGGSEYRYFKKIHQGQPLYVLTYGSFASRAAAQAAVKTLPAKLQAGKPWPRTIGSIQQEMSR
ncbi:SPOR domain-containing protein [Pseudomonas sp. GOM7]|uniref:AAA family ATPase n=1 Tax=Pseudomonas sp. GOM7 TaxID=2998079 RepID=UPI00227C56D0|nr:AAA family ATPase [Pseudomonas sp. GOM7]WAJ38133.1 SPOR domain-containing protein [Pseudomonas sp. GOM7]